MVEVKGELFYQKLLFEDHLADDAVDGLQRQLKHLREAHQTQSVVSLPIGKDVRPQGLLLDFPTKDSFYT